MNKSVIAFCCIIITAVILAGCTGIPDGGPVQGSDSGAVSLTPGPVETLPSERSIDIQINEKDTSYATISVIFAGGKGQAAVTSIDVRVTRADGQVIVEKLKPEKGTELKIQGSKEDDRIEVYVSYNDGTTYKIIDRLLPYRTRG